MPQMRYINMPYMSCYDDGNHANDFTRATKFVC